MNTEEQMTEEALVMFNAAAKVAQCLQAITQSACQTPREGLLALCMALGAISIENRQPGKGYESCKATTLDVLGRVMDDLIKVHANV